MFEELGKFAQTFPQSPENGEQVAQVQPLRRRKTLTQKICFWGANLLFMPLVVLLYAAVIAEGLRQVMGIFSMRLYNMPVPGAGLLRDYDGWDRLDLALLMAVMLFAAITYIWCRIFTELMGFGELAEQRTKNPFLFFLLSGIAAVIVLADVGLFYVGLESKAASGWGETPAYVPLVASIAYMAGLALLGWFHADYHCSGTV